MCMIRDDRIKKGEAVYNIQGPNIEVHQGLMFQSVDSKRYKRSFQTNL